MKKEFLKKFYNLINYVKNIIVFILVKFLYKYSDAIISNSRSAKIFKRISFFCKI